MKTNFRKINIKLIKPDSLQVGGLSLTKNSSKRKNRMSKNSSKLCFQTMSNNLLLLIRLLTNIFGNQSIVRKFLSDVERMRKVNGLPFTIKYMKAVKLSITRFVAGKPINVNHSLVSITNGFPTKFLYLKDFVATLHGKRLINSLLTYTRALKPLKKEIQKPNYNTISDPYKGKNYTIPTWYIDRFVSNYNLKSAIPKWDNDLHYISNKSSPFGKATLSGLYGLFYMLNVATTPINYMSNLLGNRFDKVLKPVLELVYTDHRSFVHLKTPKSPGKLSIVEDPELKRRIIAMVDYYSQWLLRPIHDCLLKLLTHFPCDRTFTQDPFHQWEKGLGNSFWSLDLTAATDRFPIFLQEKLLSKIFDENLSSNWKGLLIDRDYETPEGNSIRYSVGQPMGAYSSWAAFTITHHLVVQWAAYISTGKDNFKNYIILGDDIVIRNDKVARRYIKIMNKLGVDISMQKTHVSINTYEFAKRWIHQGKEVSGLSLRGIVNNLNNPITIINIVYEYLRRIPSLLKGSVVDILKESMRGIKLNKRYISNKKLYKLIDSTILVIRFNLKTITYQEIRQYFFKYVIIDELNLPKEDEIYRFMDRVLSLGLQVLAEKSANSLKQYYEKFLETFPASFDKINLKHNPIVHGLYIKLKQIKSRIQKNSRNNSLDLIDSISDFRIDEPDKLVENVRKSSKQIFYLDQVFKNSFKVLNSINERNYNNFVLDTQDLYGARPFESYFISSLDENLYKLELLRIGYKAPEKNDFPQMW